MTPEALSQAEQYRRDGYLVVGNLLSRREIERLRQRTSDIADGRVPEFPSAEIEFEPVASVVPGSTRQLARPAVRKLNRCAENDPIFLAHARNSQILEIVESLIGPDIKLYGSQCFMKPPGGVEKPFHQDSAYFTIEPMNLVTCWTALDDVTDDNGPVCVIPGSHRQGLMDHSREWFIGDRRDKQVPDELLDGQPEASIKMSAGSCSFHHSLLLHRSSANQSENHRRGLAVHYMPSQCFWTHATKPQPEYLVLKGREYPGCV